MFKVFKKTISLALIFVLTFNGLPVQFMNFGGGTQVYADESASAVGISYDDFSNIENLQLNGNNLIENDAIQFESGGGIGESVFTKEAVTLGEDLSFSTAFTFRTSSPSSPIKGTKGGFTFTLQTVGNTATANDFHDENIEPSLSISFIANYTANQAAKLNKGPLLASLDGFRVASESRILCETSSTLYFNGDYAGGKTGWLDWHEVNGELPEYYNIWIGYDGKEQILYMFWYNPIDGYNIYSWDMDLSEILTGEVYAGFMGSLGDAGNKNEISKWYFKNDTSLYDKAIVDYNTDWLTDEKVHINYGESDDAHAYLMAPGQGEFVGSISWESDNTELIGTDGWVTRPDIIDGDQEVTMTATISSGVVEQKKQFHITVKALGRTNEEMVSEDCSWLTDARVLNGNDTFDNVTGNMYLPERVYFGNRSTISWESDNPEVIGKDGTVTRPSFTEGNQEVTLTATIRRGSVELQKIYHVKVRALGLSDAEVEETDYSWLSDTLVLEGNGALDNVTENLYLPILSYSGSTISWESDNAEVIATDGTVTRPGITDGDKEVILTATIRRDGGARDKVFYITVKSLGAIDAEAVNIDYSWLTGTIVLNGNSALNNITGDLNLPSSGNNGSTINWTSSNTAVVNTDGTVTRSTFTEGDKTIALTASISMGSSTVGKVFHIIVKALEQTDEEAVNAINSWLTDTLVLNENNLLDNVTGNLHLPTQGEFGSTISWVSDNTEVIATDGTVTRPDKIDGNQEVALTATISRGPVEVEKVFHVKVRAVGLSDAEMVNADYSWLTNALVRNGNSGLNNIIGNLYLPTHGNNGSTISWDGNVEVIAADGTVTRPSYTDGDQEVYLRAIISNGSTERVKIFHIIVKALGATDEEAANADYSRLTDTLVLNGNNSFKNVTGNLYLPIDGKYGSVISWASGNTEVIAVDGTVTRPSFTDGNQEVNLTAILSKGLVKREKTFHVKVRALGLSNAEVLENDKLWLSDALVLNGNGASDNVTENLHLPTTGDRGSYISWSSDNTAVVNTNGTVTRPTFTEGDKSVYLTASLIMDWELVTKTFHITVKALKLTDAETVNADHAWLTDTIVLNGNNALNNITANLNLPSSGNNGSTISWTSSNTAAVNTNGTVTRPTFTEGDKTITLTATISMGSEARNKTFYITVKALAATDAEVVNIDHAWLTDTIVLNGNSALNNITANLNLPTAGNNGSTIIWTSDNTAVVNTNGTVTRPTFTEGDKTITLTATISKGPASSEKTFNITVKALGPTDAEAVNTDYVWLTDTLVLNGNSALNNITVNLNLPSSSNNGSTIIWTSSNTAVVNTNGTVTRPTFTQGDQTITLIATISKGASTMDKTFNITVKAADQTDAEKVEADTAWLTNTIILNGNSALNNVTGNLSLPDVAPMGSTIIWTSSNTAVVDMNGTVTRPTYTQGDQTITLTATISKGASSVDKPFIITVKANYMTNEEMVARDYEWLTAARILRDNVSLDNVTGNLYFPVMGMDGVAGSSISWASSSQGFVTIGGYVYRPMFHLGDQTVTLTATIRKGSASLKKTFTVTVKCLDLTDDEAVNEDFKWLKGYNILGGNLSANSVTQDLSFPTSGPYASIVTWSSNGPGIISHDGKVIRPENRTGNKYVKVTATVAKGSFQKSEIFTYIVLEKSDTAAPMVVNTTPANNTTGVLWDTKQITITYNENIILNQSPGIELRASNTIQNAARVENNKLIITPYSDLSSGENKVLIPAGAVADAAGNPSEAYEMKFMVEPKLVKNIEVISSSPYDTEKDVDIDNIDISIRFDSADIVTKGYAGTIWMRKKDGYSPWYGYLATVTGDTLTGNLTGQKLDPGTVYEIDIPAGIVQDRFLNKNSKKVIQFKTKGAAVVIPEVASVYPADGQTGVSVNPNIEVVFSGVQQLKNNRFTLTDALGNAYELYAPYTLDMFETKLILMPKQSLKPNTTYTLSGSYGSAANPSLKKFSTRFTTGSGPRGIKSSPRTGDWNASTHGVVEIQFDTPVTKGSNFKDITFKDYLGRSVEFVGEETGSKVVLKALSELELYMPYTVYIPYGAYKNSAGAANDQNRITFYTTEEKLPTKLELSHLDVLDVGFVGKAFKISVNIPEMTSWENYVRALGYGPISYEWSIDDALASTKGLFYHTFSSPGKHEITFTAKDRYGFSYTVKKTVEIQTLQDVTMSLKDSGKIMTIHIAETGTQPVLDYELRLEQSAQFIYGENIDVKLYKDGVLQRRFGEYGDGGKTITSKYGDQAYMFAYTPEYGDSGTYELEFTYKGLMGDQVIRQPFIVTSQKPAVTDVFRFRLYEDKWARYYEELNYVYVILNGERFKANKEMYTYEGSTFPVYALRKTLQTNTYYNFKVENWWGKKDNTPFYLGKGTAKPAILTGTRGAVGAGMGIKNVTVNHSESELKGRDDLYFEGMSTKLVLNVEGDWAGTDPGYYEIGILNYDTAASSTSFTQAHDNKSEIQKITVSPGIQLKGNSEQFLIRMVSSQGYKSGWKLCPAVYLLPVPSVLGKKLNISVQDGEYAINWPTVFDGPIGGTINTLNGIPVVGGGNFGLGGNMPNFEGKLLEDYDIMLNFEAEGGYGQKNKTSKSTKYKKVKKVTVVGYEFEIELEGDVLLSYNWETGEWSTKIIYILIDGDGTKSFDKGYEMFGVGFTAGVSVGTRVRGVLIIENGNDTEFSGTVGIRPHADLHVNGNFGVAAVYGSLEASIPAEISFPTGYIGADISVDANIKANALLWSKTLYEENLYKVHWDNGNPKVVYKALQAPNAEIVAREDDGLQLMPRDYLGRQSNWLGGDAATEQTQTVRSSASLRRLNFFGTGEASTEANPNISVMMENIYPESETQLVVNGDQLWLVWSDDNPERDAVNRTQLRYSVLKDGAWSEPVWINDDGTADFAPVVAVAGNGVLMAWHNISKVLTEEEGLDEMLESSEISVTESIYAADGSQPDIINLTDDDKLDHSPKIAAGGDKALLVWTKSEGLSFDLDAGENSSTQPGDQLFFSAWSNGTWTTPGAIEMESSTVLDSSLAIEGEEGLLLYTLDMDNDLSTGEDREVFARLYDGNAWGGAMQLTDNQLNDSAPKAVYVDEKWFITWLEEGKILYKAGLDGEIKTEAWLENIQSDYRIIAKEGEGRLAALLYTQPGEDKALGMYSSFYDFDNGKWSDKIGLAIGNQYTKAISASFDGDGKLNAAFTQADIITEAKPQIIDGKEELIETKSISNKADLKLLTYTPVHDVALLEEAGMSLATEFPLPGAVTPVYVMLRNEGDFAENAAIYLYDGNPDEGGLKIAETAPQFIPARSSQEIEIGWLVGPEEKKEYDLYAVVRPNDRVQETNTDNNTVTIKISTSDIAVTGLTCENPAASDYLISVTIANRGSSVLDEAKVWLEDEVSGEVLETTLLETIGLGEETALTYMISSNGRKNMRVRVTLPEEVTEDNTDNNTRSFLLEPASFELKNLNIGPGDEQVDVASAMRLEFNMSVGKGAGFDQIRLMDEELNDVAINKAIENNTLIIKPQNPLERGTGYRLTIPADALGDSYGHALKRAFDMGFTTMTANPEVVSAYPGADMNNAAIDTAIRLKFNQNVTKGNAFLKIELYKHADGSEAEAIPVSASIKGELLTIKYAGSLRANTTYTLEIPRGAVENVRGETQQVDYVLAFTTGSTSNGHGDDTGNDGGEDDDDVTDNNNDSVVSSGNQQNFSVRTGSDGAIINLEGSAANIFSGDKNTVIKIPATPTVNAYTLEISANLLTVTPGKASLTLDTGIGSITIPSGMLSGMEDLGGKTANITIATGDKSKLSDVSRAAIGSHPLIQLTLTIDGQQTGWNNPAAPVMVSIPYKPTAAEIHSPECIIIKYIDGNGNLITIPNGRYDQSSGMVIFSTTHFSYYAVGYNKVSFNDVAVGGWYDKAVSFIAARDITTGTGDGNYSPNMKLTRGQFIVMLMKAYDIAPDKNPTDNFSDAGDAYYTDYLAAAKKLGISEGIGNNMYAPDKEITRQEMFTLLYKALKVNSRLPKGASGKTLSDFTDAGQIDFWAVEAMKLLVETGTVGGSSGKLTPDSTTTRAEMAQVLYNLMSK